jgi:thermostable 8-oxoguanine DNA glycosylase
MDIKIAHDKIASIARRLAQEKQLTLNKLKAEYHKLSRPDFLWHYLLQSFSTMGRASGWEGLIGNKNNYNKLRYENLAELPPNDRARVVEQTCKDAKIRMPSVKADYILKCFEQIKAFGGPETAKKMLFSQVGREGKIRFLKKFSGIGDKYARNIMMDVYHEDFRDSIALDVRIKSISDAYGLTFTSYTQHEEFYLSVAREAGINGWELDRLIFNFKDSFLVGSGAI